MPNPAARPHRSWRKSDGSAGSGGSRPAAKWISSLLVLALLVAFGVSIYLLWPGRLPQTHFVAILTGETHKFTVPPLPFASEDLAPLELAELRSFQFYDRSELQEADKITGLGQWLRGLTEKDHDLLLLYLSAHGVSDNGIPFLLCRDFDLSSHERARYALVDLLKELKGHRFARSCWCWMPAGFSRIRGWEWWSTSSRAWRWSRFSNGMIRRCGFFCPVRRSSRRR